jgi:uncharacterized membrane protein YkoI
MFVGDVIWGLSGGVASFTQTPEYPISHQEASSIALDTAPSATLAGEPELTSYKGAVAYKVPLDLGTIYVEATTGRILANTAATASDAQPTN